MDEVLWLLLLSVITVARGGTEEKPRVTRAEFSKVPCLYDTRRVENVRIRVLCKHISGRVRVRLRADEGLHVARGLLHRRIVTAEAGWNAYYARGIVTDQK